jgi:type I restriction enzyme, S subunit
VTSGPAWVTDNAIFAKKISERVSLEYAHLVFKNARLNENAGGSGQPFVNQDILNEVTFPLPSIKEQHEIVRRVSVVCEAFDQSVDEQIKAMKLLERLDQAILSKAFRGELVLQDQVDGSAAVLLQQLAGSGSKVSAGRVRRRVKASRNWE